MYEKFKTRLDEPFERLGHPCEIFMSRLNVSNFFMSRAKVLVTRSKFFASCSNGLVPRSEFFLGRSNGLNTQLPVRTFSGTH